MFKGTPLRSGRVKNLQKPCFVLLSTCVRHSSLSCGTLICILSVGNVFITGITCIPVDLGNAQVMIFLSNRNIPILNRVAKSIEDILGYHKICFIHYIRCLQENDNNVCFREKEILLSVLHDQTSVESL